MSNGTGPNYNAIALAAIICGSLVACMAIFKDASIVEVVALVGVFTTIAGTVVGRE